MAVREAGIRLTLDTAAFTRGMETIGSKARQVGGKIKSGLSEGFKGVGGSALKAGSDSVKELTGSIKSAIGNAAALGGGIGFGVLIKRASDLRSGMRDLAFAVNKTGKATADWQDMLANTNSAAQATGQSSDKLAQALAAMWEGGGDMDFAQKALIPIGHAAQASGKDVLRLANVATMLQEKFGATAENLPEMLAVVTQMTDAGGLSLDAMGDKFGLLAGEAVDAGFAGAEGMAGVLGMLNALDDRLGEKSIPAFKKLFQTLKDGSGSLKEISKASGLKLGGMEGADKLRAIMGNDKARKAMTEKLGGEQRVVFDLLAKPFVDAAAEAKKNGAKGKEATQAGLRAFDEAMRGMGESTLKYQDLVEHSTAKQADDPQIKINKAVERLAAKFTEPKMMGAIDRLTELLPRVADGMADLLEFAMDHPLLAGGAYLAKTAGISAVGAGVGKVGENVGGALKSALAGQGKAWATDFAGSVKGSGWASTAGKALGVAAAGIIAYEITTALIDARVEEKAKNQKEGVEAGIQAFNAKNSGNVGEMQAAKAALEANIAKLKDEQSGMGGAFDTFMGGLVTVMPGGDPNYVDPNIKALSDAQYELSKLNQAIAETTAKLQGAGKATDDMAGATKKAGQAASGAASAFYNVGGAVPTDTTGNGVTKGPGGVANPSKPGYFG